MFVDREKSEGEKMNGESGISMQKPTINHLVFVTTLEHSSTPRILATRARQIRTVDPEVEARHGFLVHFPLAPRSRSDNELYFYA